MAAILFEGVRHTELEVDWARWLGKADKGQWAVGRIRNAVARAASGQK